MQEIQGPALVAKPKFEVGNRVTRPYNVHDPKSKLMHGTIVRVYSLQNTRFGDYPELYAVRWDETDVKESGNGYLPHGLNKS